MTLNWDQRTSKNIEHAYPEMYPKKPEITQNGKMFAAQRPMTPILLPKIHFPESQLGRKNNKMTS